MKDLGALEATVMQRLWSWEREVSVREVVEDLQRERDIAYTTVMTVLDNLHRKDLVRRTKVGRAYRYSATASQGAYTAEMLDEVLSATDDRSSALLHFVDRLGTDDLADLRQLLDRTGDQPQ